jgi:hypothetical protein
LQLVQLDGRDLAGVFAKNPLWSPVTVVGSRVAPFQDIIPNSTVTDILFDAPLAKLEIIYHALGGEEAVIRNLTSSILYDYTNSYYGSTDFQETVDNSPKTPFPTNS